MNESVENKKSYYLKSSSFAMIIASLILSVGLVCAVSRFKDAERVVASVEYRLEDYFSAVYISITPVHNQI